MGEDIEAIHYAMGCGCKMIATVHGGTIDEIKEKPMLGDLVKKRVFERYVIMNNKDHIGKVTQISDRRGTTLYLYD